MCAVQGEEEWWEAWGNVIAAAVIDRRVGWITADDLLDMAMRPRRDLRVSRNWGGNGA